jgi:type IV pilus assembly protein PilQ
MRALIVLLLLVAAPLARAEERAGRRRPAPRLTVHLVKVDIHNVLRVIADVSRLNIVVADDVQGTVTLHLRNVPWNEVLDAVLVSRGLGMERLGTIVRVAPLKQLQEEARLRAELSRARVEAAPLVTRIIPVNYARAADLVPHVKASLSPRGTVSYDQRTNVLIVKDVP